MTDSCESTTRNWAKEFCSWKKFKKKAGVSPEKGI
jgi:hypothetical protein